MEILTALSECIDNLISYMGYFGPLLGCILILIESMIPVLPLCLFITINCVSFGYLIGSIISWIFTCLGCYISFKICDTKFKNIFDRKLRNKKSVDKFMKKFENCKLSTLAIIVAIPFTPAFFVNIAAGLSKMDSKKFITGICIGKIFMVYFWAFIGTSLIQSLTNPIIIVRVIIMLIVAYIISKIISKKLNI